MAEDQNTSIVVNLESLFLENPQLVQENVRQMTSETKVLRYNGETLEAVNVDLLEHSEYPPDTKVYFIEVEGDETYIVDNFVAKHELPNFAKWPLTFLTIGLLTKSVKLQFPANLETNERTLKFLVNIHQ